MALLAIVLIVFVALGGLNMLANLITQMLRTILRMIGNVVAAFLFMVGFVALALAIGHIQAFLLIFGTLVAIAIIRSR
jgi:hypothetical protein